MRIVCHRVSMHTRRRNRDGPSASAASRRHSRHTRGCDCRRRSRPKYDDTRHQCTQTVSSVQEHRSSGSKNRSSSATAGVTSSIARIAQRLCTRTSACMRALTLYGPSCLTCVPSGLKHRSNTVFLKLSFDGIRSDHVISVFIAAAASGTRCDRRAAGASVYSCARGSYAGRCVRASSQWG
jgi:hypothetical protein